MTDNHNIDLKTLQSRLDKGDIRLVDALPSDAYREGHIPGALSLPYTDAETKASEVLPRKDDTIVTYCAHKDCDASEKTASKLRDLGYKNVMEFTGGKKDWVEAGLKLEPYGSGKENGRVSDESARKTQESENVTNNDKRVSSR